MNATPQTHTLTNGLPCILVPMPGVKSATVLALVKAGTRYENLQNNGISHFLEHMVFKGTQKYPTALDITSEVDNVGGNFNAFTDKEYTGYYVKAAISQLDLAMNVVSQLTFAPTIPAEDLEIERGVILEEIRMYEDEPQAKVAQLYEKVMFAPTTLGWDTLGTPEVIRNLKRETFLEYLNYLYTPNRMTVVVAGGIDEAETLEKLNQYFNTQKPLTTLPSQNFQFSYDQPRKQVLAKKTEQCHLIYGYPTFGRGNKDRYVLSILGTILGGGMSSRLFTEIRDKRGLAYYVSTMVDLYAEGGYFAVRAGTKPESAQEVIDLSQAEFDKLCQERVGNKELTKAKEFIKGHLWLGLENSYEVADFYAEDMLLEGKFRTIEEVIDGLNAVTAEDVQRLAGELFQPQKRTLAAIGPEEYVEALKIEEDSVSKPLHQPEVQPQLSL